jgi:hypothetical protein
MNTEILTRDTAAWPRPFEDAMAAAFRELDAQSRVEEHLVAKRDFFEPKSIQELAQSQGVGPVKDISVFAGAIPEDEDIDEMLEEIYRSREP